MNYNGVNMDLFADALQEVDVLKHQLQSLRPLQGEALQKIRNALNVEYTYESNRIEGNTLTLQETALVVEEGLTISGKSMREHLEAINHNEAIAYIYDLADKNVPVSAKEILNLHAIVLHNIDKENAGKYRNVPVMISGSNHTPPQPYLIEKQIEDFFLSFRKLQQENVHPVVTAAFLHDELVRIHPFVDGNGRTSRLLMNLYLLKNGYTTVVLKGDNDSRVAYYKALEASHCTDSHTDFIRLVIDAEIYSLQRYIDLMK